MPDTLRRFRMNYPPSSLVAGLIWLLSAAGLALQAPPKALAYELDRIIAVVDEEVILQSELDRQIDKIRDQLRQQGTTPPPQDVLQTQVLERLILQKLQLGFASRIGIDVDDATLEKAISNIAERNNLSVGQFREILAKDGYAFSDFEEDIRNEIIIARLIQQEVENRVRVSQNEVRLFLSNQGAEGEAVEYRLRHILVSTASHGQEGAEARISEARQRLASGEDFGSVAASLSDGQQALEGGDLGWRKGSELPSLFAEVVPPMAVGEVSRMITSPSGFHLVKLEDKRAGEQILVEQTLCQHILIKTNEVVTDEAARDRLRQLLLRLEGGADFSALARTHSDDRASALDGGDLGWVSPGQMVPEFEEMMKRTTIGEVSRMFQTDFGWHILKVNDRRTYDGTREVREARARAAIRQRKLDEELQLWLQRLRDEAWVDIRLAG